MFTGIVQGKAEVTAVERRPGLITLTLGLPQGLGQGLARGASVAVSGVCLTATDIDGDRVSFDVMQETLDRTTLGSLSAGDRVNVERSYRVGDEVGGHIVSGHVAGTADIVGDDRRENNRALTFRCDPSQMRYILPKGFVALDGCSLTLVDVDQAAATFSVWLIPETLRVTTFGDKGLGARVNLEIDRSTQAIVDTVERYLGQRFARDPA